MPPSSLTKTSSSSASEAIRRVRRIDPGTADAGPPIELRGVSLRFVSYHDKQYSFKRAMLDLVMRRDDAPKVSEFWALRDLDLKIHKGDRVGIVGHNGAGKSTLLRLLARIYPPTTGTVAVRGNVAPLIEMGAGFNPELSGQENILLNGAMLGYGRKEMESRIDGIFDFTGLRDFADLPLKYYSSGMYTRLAFAIATEIDPDILLIDESLGAGDAAFVEKAKARILGLLDRSNVVVIVSHDLGALKDTCTRGLWMKGGRLVGDGPMDEIIDRYTLDATGRTLTTVGFPSAAELSGLPEETTEAHFEFLPVRVPGQAYFEMVVDRGNDEPGVAEYRQGNYWADALIELMAQFTPPGGYVLDLGANMGGFALAAAALGRQVIAVDASPKHVDLVRRGALHNGLDNVRVVHGAASDRPGTLRFFPDEQLGRVAYPGLVGRTLDVPALTMDDLIDDSGWPRVDFVKIDIEGSEVAALRGMRKLLAGAEAPVILCESNDYTLQYYGLEVRHLLGLLEDYGYRVYRGPHFCNSGKMHRCRPAEFQPELGVDVVALKPSHVAAVADRLAPALPHDELVERTVREGSQPWASHRGYIARALAGASAEVLRDERIKTLLDGLARDEAEAVRKAADWWVARSGRSVA